MLRYGFEKTKNFDFDVHHCARLSCSRLGIDAIDLSSWFHGIVIMTSLCIDIASSIILTN